MYTVHYTSCLEGALKGIKYSVNLLKVMLIIISDKGSNTLFFSVVLLRLEALSSNLFVYAYLCCGTFCSL